MMPEGQETFGIQTNAVLASSRCDVLLVLLSVLPSISGSSLLTCCLLLQDKDCRGYFLFRSISSWLSSISNHYIGLVPSLHKMEMPVTRGGTGEPNSSKTGTRTRDLIQNGCQKQSAGPFLLEPLKPKPHDQRQVATSPRQQLEDQKQQPRNANGRA